MGVLSTVRQLERQTGVLVRDVYLEGEIITVTGESIDLKKRGFVVLIIEKEGKEIVVPCSEKYFRGDDDIAENLFAGISQAFKETE